MRARSLAPCTTLLALVGCHTARPAAPPPPGPRSAFAAADLAALDGHSIVLYDLADDELRELERVNLEHGDGDDDFVTGAMRLGDWAGRGALYVHAGEHRVVRLDERGLEEIPLPPRESFVTARPTDEPDATEFSWERLVVTSDDEVWYGRCPWGLPYDAGDCLVWVWVRLAPSPARSVGPDAYTGRRLSWPKVEVPSGYVVEIPESDEGPRELRCRGGGEQMRVESAGDEGEIVDEGRWLTGDQPLLLVVMGAFGLADLVPTRWSLHAGCKGSPLATGTVAEPGPDGLWIGRDDERTTIRRGAKVLGTIAGAPDLAFRPR